MNEVPVEAIQLVADSCKAILSGKPLYLTIVGKKPPGFPAGRLVSSKFKDDEKKVAIRSYEFDPVKMIGFVARLIQNIKPAAEDERKIIEMLLIELGEYQVFKLSKNGKH